MSSGKLQKEMEQQKFARKTSDRNSPSSTVFSAPGAQYPKALVQSKPDIGFSMYLSCSNSFGFPRADSISLKLNVNSRLSNTCTCPYIGQQANENSWGERRREGERGRERGRKWKREGERKEERGKQVKDPESWQMYQWRDAQMIEYLHHKDCIRARSPTVHRRLFKDIGHVNSFSKAIATLRSYTAVSKDDKLQLADPLGAQCAALEKGFPHNW